MANLLDSIRRSQAILIKANCKQATEREQVMCRKQAEEPAQSEGLKSQASPGCWDGQRHWVSDRMPSFEELVSREGEMILDSRLHDASSHTQSGRYILTMVVRCFNDFLGMVHTKHPLHTALQGWRDETWLHTRDALIASPAFIPPRKKSGEKRHKNTPR